jgi:CubicO group peptidase (beta-lactamase class C family)
MTLYEKGYFQLMHPVAQYIPAFADLKVYAGQKDGKLELEDLQRPITIHDLLTHTSGLSYHFLEYGPVEEMYRTAKISSNKTLKDFVDDLLKMPLAFQPGTSWRYSFSHDVVAYLIEVLSAQSLDGFLQENLFNPLSMIDTGFYVPEAKHDRFAAMYGSSHLLEPDTTLSNWFNKAFQGDISLLATAENSLESKPHKVFRGGHGLVSTAQDYFNFSQMLLNKGKWDGKTLLSRKTIELMTVNRIAPELLPFETAGIIFPSYGYGLGMRTMMDLGQARVLGSVGEHGWAGGASTYYWIDPKEELIGIVLTQFQPMGFHPVAPDFRTLAYQAIVD